MIRLPCPWCGARNVDEFAWHGEVAVRPDPASATRERWRAYLYLRDNPFGWVRETWYHRMGCERWLVVERHTGTGEVRTCVDGGERARPRRTDRADDGPATPAGPREVPT